MSELNRRRFLEDSMFAATAALAAAGTSQVLAADQRPSSSANDTLNVAVIGVRGQGNSHLTYHANPKHKGTQVTYVCDADRDIGMKRVEEAAKLQGRAPKFVQDLREVMDDPSVDIVSTATPNHWHALVAIWAMQNGKDVYVEKPVSHNVSEGRRMVEAARKYKRICQTGTQCRSMGGTIQAIDYVKAGKIGDVKIARGLCYKRRKSIGEPGQYMPPASVDYNLWTGPAPMTPLTRPQLHYDWHWVWPTGNGDLGNQGIHQMDIARWGLGVDRLSDAVFSYGGRLGYVDAGETANTQVIEHTYGDQKLVFEVRGLETGDLRGAKVGVIFEGTDGYVVLTSYTGGAAFDLDGKLVAKFSGGGDHHGNFVEAVRSRQRNQLAADILEGHLSSALCHLGNISLLRGEQIAIGDAESQIGEDEDSRATFGRFREHLAQNGVAADAPVRVGKRLKLNFEKETFADDSVADAMLTRQYRTPFVVPAAGQV